MSTQLFDFSGGLQKQGSRCRCLCVVTSTVGLFGIGILYQYRLFELKDPSRFLNTLRFHFFFLKIFTIMIYLGLNMLKFGLLTSMAKYVEIRKYWAQRYPCRAMHLRHFICTVKAKA